MKYSVTLTALALTASCAVACGESSRPDGRGDRASSGLVTEISVSTTVRLEAGTTSTSEVGAYGSAQERILRIIGYTDSEAEKVLSRVNTYARLLTTHATEIVSALDLTFSSEGATSIQQYVEAVANSNHIYVWSIEGRGDISFKIVPSPKDDTRAAVFVPSDLPHPLSAFEFSGRSTSFGLTNYGLTLIKVNQSSLRAVYEANALAVTEGLMREGSIQVLSGGDPRDGQLNRLLEELAFNLAGRTAGNKMVGVTMEDTAVAVSGSELNLPNIGRHRLPKYEPLFWTLSPSPENRMFS